MTAQGARLRRPGVPVRGRLKAAGEVGDEAAERDPLRAGRRLAAVLPPAHGNLGDAERVSDRLLGDTGRPADLPGPDLQQPGTAGDRLRRGTAGHAAPSAGVMLPLMTRSW